MHYVESETLELKREYTVDIKKEIVAFLNGKGGTIYIGIDDDGKAVGVEDAPDLIERVSMLVHEAIKPDPSLLVSAEEKNEEGKTIIVINVSEGLKKPYYIYEKGLKPSGVYIRVNNTSQWASEGAIKQMILESEDHSYESLVSKDQDLTFSYLQMAFKKENIELKERTLGLKNAQGQYTNLALLLSDECPFSIKAAVFDSDDKSRFIDRKEFEGSLLQQADEAYSYLRLNNKQRGEYKGILREDKSDYDDLVLREGLLNAIIHRDYALNGSILISIYDNRIEYISIGGLVSGMTYEDMMLGVSRSRNERLANVFFKLRYVEAYGTGIEKILGDYENSPIKPHFEISDNGFLLMVPNKFAMTEAHKIVSDEDEVLDFIRQSKCVTRAEVQEKFAFKLSKTRNILLRLEQKGKIARSGKGRETCYFAKN